MRTDLFRFKFCPTSVAVNCYNAYSLTLTPVQECHRSRPKFQTKEIDPCASSTIEHCKTPTQSSTAAFPFSRFSNSVR
ncbi:hypothetical protein L1987_61440 [Smallanthus sonchifolius]|uniref:Uncharacterized protein n=1 Tax=Smallanthus sonchifolius TaxID=185202 RepID=A0ACB9C7L4_9ASTR|nr:hypothetical protein L1987_61440 [Smallanthus sonchifolius]